MDKPVLKYYYVAFKSLYEDGGSRYGSTVLETNTLPDIDAITEQVKEEDSDPIELVLILNCFECSKPKKSL